MSNAPSEAAGRVEGPLASPLPSGTMASSSSALGLHPSLRRHSLVRRPHRRPEDAPTYPQRRTRRNLHRATETRAPYLFGGIRNSRRSAESRATVEALEWCEEGSSDRTGHIRAEATEWLSAAKEALTRAKVGCPYQPFELRLASHAPFAPFALDRRPCTPTSSLRSSRSRI